MRHFIVAFLVSALITTGIHYYNRPEPQSGMILMPGESISIQIPMNKSLERHTEQDKEELKKLLTQI